MLQLIPMLEQLDQNKAKKQQVYVYHLQYADVDNVAEILRNIFESNSYNSINRSSTSSTNQNTLSKPDHANPNLRTDWGRAVD